jgi:hypothetical protein
VKIEKDFFFINRFAIIWIPLLLLLIFNTILISYVRRSKQSKQQNSEGVELRRHNGGNQSEQRKTTIMLSRSINYFLLFFLIIISSLVAVVLVFTVCQIPQAISLTLQSFFPKLAQTSKVLIYNNFANCLVALNASMNFLLYCCFSDRFRSTFRSNFTFLSKYCAHYIQPNKYQSNHSISLDNMTCVDHSNYSLHGNYLNIRRSHISIDINPKYLNHLHQKFDGKRFSISSPKFKSTNPLILVRHIPTSSVSAAGADRTLKLSNNEPTLKHAPATEKLFSTPSKRQSLSLYGLNRPILKPRLHSYRSLTDNNKNRELIWIKRHQSNSTIEQLLNRRKSSGLKDIIDVTV